MIRKSRMLTARHVAPIKRRLRTLDRHDLTTRADIAQIQVEIYDLTSRIDALERKTLKVRV